MRQRQSVRRRLEVGTELDIQFMGVATPEGMTGAQLLMNLADTDHAERRNAIGMEMA